MVLVAPLALGQVAEEPTRADIAAKLRGVDAGDLRDSTIGGFYEIRAGARVGYITRDGRYLFEGEVYDLESSRNLTENARSEARVDLLAGVDPASMIIYAPASGPVTHTITMFTDIDCGYCRQFHREIDQVTALGIEVRYLSYPRTGPDTESWDKAEKVWCSDNRNASMTDAKLGGHVPETGCANNPVAAHYDLGRQVGVTGTPSIYAEDGTHIGGYLPPAQLLETLNQLAAQ